MSITPNSATVKVEAYNGIKRKEHSRSKATAKLYEKKFRINSLIFQNVLAKIDMYTFPLCSKIKEQYPFAKKHPIHPMNPYQ